MQEIKYAIYYTDGAVGAYEGYNVDITPLFKQGAEKSRRIGRKIQYKFLQLRLNLALSAISGATTSIVFLRIVLWQPRISVPLSSTAANALTIWDQPINYAMISSINNNYARVLLDRTYTLGVAPNGGTTNLPVAFALKKKVRINNFVNFPADGIETPSDPKDRYYMTIITDVGATNLVNMGLRWMSRISFYDM